IREGLVMPIVRSRRSFLSNSVWAGAAGLSAAGTLGLGGGRTSYAGEPPPEITTIRFEKDPVTCIAPQVFDELLRDEGFTSIPHIDATEAHIGRAEAAKTSVVADMLDRGEVDFGREYAPNFVLGMNAGAAIKILSGLHVGCFEVFGKDEI